MPPWVRRLERGDDAGLFTEDGPAWTVHAGMPTLVAGIRALLMQALQMTLGLVKLGKMFLLHLIILNQVKLIVQHNRRIFNNYV